MKKETLKTKTLAPGRAGAGVSGPRGYTLDSLVPLLGLFEENVRTVIYDLVSEQELLKRGKRVDSDRILGDVPLFLGSTYDIWQALSETQRKKVNIEQHIFALCLDETLKLRQLREGHQVVTAENAGSRAESKVDKRQAVRALRAGRRSLLASLNNGLGEAARAHAKGLAGTASTTATLVQGSERLADYVTQLIGTASESARVQLGSFNLTTERIVELRNNVADVRAATAVTPTRAGRVEQRKLDIQDGRVLFLIERIVRAFRAAQHEDSTILVPELRALAGLFASRPSRPKTSPDPTTPPTPPAPSTKAPSTLSGHAGGTGTSGADCTIPPPAPPVEAKPAEK